MGIIVCGFALDPPLMQQPTDRQRLKRILARTNIQGRTRHRATHCAIEISLQRHRCILQARIRSKSSGTLHHLEPSSLLQNNSAVWRWASCLSAPIFDHERPIIERRGFLLKNGR
jgi:hypothetical protein